MHPQSRLRISLNRLWLLLFLCLPCSASEDLYTILGVKRDASTREIKRAYRRKAKDTHPDKNSDQEKATEEFRKVVDAFEILSDPNARRNYDRTGRTGSHQAGSSSSSHSRRSSSFQFFTQSRRRQRSLKDDPRVKEAQLRVMHVVSLEQLQTVILDENDELLERSLLICFVTPKTEEIANDRLVFPYPFAGMSKQGIWWEDILQTVLVRFHRANELTRFFGIPPGDELKLPVFVLARKGDPLSKFETYSTYNRPHFEMWVWEQIRVNVRFINKHSNPVELYWADGNNAMLKATMEPGESHNEISLLSHEYIARDYRVDRFESSPGRFKLTPNARLGTWKILSTEDQVFFIETRPCVDMSGHCSYWATHPVGECERNQGFMHEKCPLTCKVCNEQDNNTKSGGQDSRGDEL